MMKKKIIGIFIVCLFIGLGFASSSSGNTPDDELDQSQTDGEGGAHVVHSTFSSAQSFVPTFNIPHFVHRKMPVFLIVTQPAWLPVIPAQ